MLGLKDRVVSGPQMAGLILTLPTQELVSPDLSKLCPFDQVTTLSGEKDKKDVQGKPGGIVGLRTKSDL